MKNNDLIEINNLNSNAKGGTELLQDRLYATLDRSLLENFQIWFSRYRKENVDPNKYQIFYAHDLPGDPESDHLRNGGWSKFHKLVFVSNWQMQGYINLYNIPWSKCSVLLNSINPIEAHTKQKDKIKLSYFSTPHRGLNILVPVFIKLAEEYDNIELDVFSSFKLYGWEERDKPFQELFDICKNHPKINYHGSVSNEEIRKNLKESHILAYPSIWQETSCLVLMEAMSAGLVCIHPNYGALYETGANWTFMYNWNEDMSKHASMFYAMCKLAIDEVVSDTDNIKSRLQTQKSYVDVFYNWENRKHQWENLLNSILQEPLSLEKQGPSISYKS